MAANRRRRYRSARPTRLPPLAIVGIVLGCAVLITLLVGNLLNHFLDDETYQKLTDGTAEQPHPDGSVSSSVRNVNAYPFRLGDSIDTIAGQTSASVLLNTAEGSLQYVSPVGDRYGLSQSDGAALHEAMTDLCFYIPYVSGIYQPRALAQSAQDLFYAAMAEDTALLHEFVAAGGSEILIYLPQFTAGDAERLLNYLQAVKSAVDGTPLGVALPYAFVTDRANWELLARFAEICDFCALDFTGLTVDGTDLDEAGLSPTAKQLLDGCNYYLSQYSMRPLFGESQIALISTAVTLVLPTFQVVSGK